MLHLMLGLGLTLTLILAPRSAQLIVPGIGLLALWAGGLGSTRLSSVFWVSIAFGLFAFASSIWSFDPSASMTKGAYAILLVLATAAAIEGVSRVKVEPLRRIAQGSILGLSISLFLLGLEYQSNQAISRSIIDWLGSGSNMASRPNEINRRTAVAAALAVPLLALCWVAVPSRLAKPASLSLFLLILVAASLTTHQSSQIALAGAAAIWLVAYLSLSFGRTLVLVAWLSAVILVIPLSTTLHSAGLQQASWLFHSAKHRIVIWNFTARKSLERPFFGIGADATPEFDEELARRGNINTEEGFKVTVSRHAHNAYLQVWFELGAIGASLLCLMGVAWLWTISSFREDTQRLALSQFAITALIISTSYSLWQMWFAAAISAGIIAAAVAIRLLSIARSNPKTS